MALTLRTAITANDTTFDVLGSDDLEAGDFKTIDSETVVIRSVRSATLAYSEAARYRVSVYRGAGGTRAAAHAANASLATYSAGGSGSLSATDGTTTVDATSFQFPAGTVSDLGAGLAGVAFGPVVYLECNTDTDSPNKFVWDTLYDADWDAIGVLPAEMGMSIDVANSTLTTLEAGTWAWVLGTNLNTTDATAILAVKVVDGGYYGSVTSVPSPVSASYLSAMAGGGPSLTGVSRMKIGSDFYAEVRVVAATASPYHPIDYAVLTLMRLS